MQRCKIWSYARGDILIFSLPWKATARWILVKIDQTLQLNIVNGSKDPISYNILLMFINLVKKVLGIILSNW